MPATEHRSPTARFWDRMAERYARTTISDLASYEKKLEITQSYFNPQTRVVEFGCGTGSTAILHAPWVEHIYATDVSGKMLEIARRKTAAENIDNITYEQKTVDELDVPRESVDVVMGMSILHLLDDHTIAIAKAFDMLKSGGVFISSTACLADSQNYFRFILPLAKVLRLAPHVSFLKRSGLEQDLAAAGFTLEKSWLPGKGKALFCVARKP